MRLRWAVAALLVAGACVGTALLPLGQPSTPDIPMTIACGFLLAAAIVTVAVRLALDVVTQFAVWFCLLFLNLAAVAIEGVLFAPAAAPPSSLGANLLRLAGGSALIAGVAAASLATRGHGDQPIRVRPLYVWLWRLVVAALVYVFLYLTLGGVNYMVVTRPYYEAHSAGLTVPPAETVFLVGPVRGLLIAMSALPLTVALRRGVGVTAVVTGAMLFLVGGLVPLLPQASLPLYLRIASLWEIFSQNFLTGAVCAYLFVGSRHRSERQQIPGVAPGPLWRR